jgi:hypothetical protein
LPAASELDPSRFLSPLAREERLAAVREIREDGQVLLDAAW